MRFIVMGGGGHARVVIDLIHRAGHEAIGFTTDDRADTRGEASQTLLGAPFLGGDEIISSHAAQDVVLANGVGSIGDSTSRRALFERLRARGYEFPPLIHPSAVLASDVTLGPGCQIMAGVVVQTGASIGANSIINTRASIDHDCRIGAHAHIAPGVTLSGQVTVDEGAHVGTGATVIQGIHIARGARVGAGAVVVDDIAAGVLVIGSPARERP
jgi:sugar O-acyltransferase (sialic acid O-acetyltransferase NeuD family)